MQPQVPALRHPRHGLQQPAVGLGGAAVRLGKATGVQHGLGERDGIFWLQPGVEGVQLLPLGQGVLPALRPGPLVGEIAVLGRRLLIGRAGQGLQGALSSC